jgi:integrase/recombinase XerD
MNVEGRGFRTDISLMNVGKEVREGKEDFHKNVSLRLKSTYHDALEGR